MSLELSFRNMRALSYHQWKSSCFRPSPSLFLPGFPLLSISWIENAPSPSFLLMPTFFSPWIYTLWMSSFLTYEEIAFNSGVPPPPSPIQVRKAATIEGGGGVFFSFLRTSRSSSNEKNETPSRCVKASLPSNPSLSLPLFSVSHLCAIIFSPLSSSLKGFFF